MRLGAGVGTFGLMCHCICPSASAISFLILSCAQGLRVVVEVCRGRGSSGGGWRVLPCTRKIEVETALGN
jgi:hypothetical protein